MVDGPVGLPKNDQGAQANSWWQILLVGALLYFTGLAILSETYNPILFPMVAFVGSFAVPISYVAFFYDRRGVTNSVSLPTVALCFFYGGVIGGFAASLLEPVIVQKMGVLPAIQVGLIEEFAKIIGVILIARQTSRTPMVTGIILGAAAGMGFAAFESNGYSFVTFIHSQGNLASIADVTVVRGLLAPIGHGTWTAILAAVLFRQSKTDQLQFDGKVIGAYIVVALLHGLWDSLPVFGMRFQLPPSSMLLSQALIGGIGLFILASLWKRAKQQQLQEDMLTFEAEPAKDSE